MGCKQRISTPLGCERLMGPLHLEQGMDACISEAKNTLALKHGDGLVDAKAGYPRAKALTGTPPRMEHEEQNCNNTTSFLAEMLGESYWPWLLKELETLDESQFQLDFFGTGRIDHSPGALHKVMRIPARQLCMELFFRCNSNKLS